MELEFEERNSGKNKAETDKNGTNIRDDSDGLNERLLIDERVFDSEGFDLVEKLFDENGIRYDFDSGDRIMIASADVNTAISILEEAGIQAELI